MPAGNDSLHDGAVHGRMPATTASAPARGSASWTGLLVAAMAGTVLLYGIDILFHPPPTISELFQKFACSVFFGAAILCVLKARAAPEERLPWSALALGMALWGTASCYYGAVLWERAEVPYPSLATQSGHASCTGSSSGFDPILDGRERLRNAT